MVAPLPLNSPYAAVNAAFNAFLEGRADDCAAAVVAEVEAITAQRAANAARRQMGEPSTGGRPSEGPLEGATMQNPTELDVSGRGALPSEEELVDIFVVCDLLKTLRAAKIDGRVYSSISGNTFAPVEHRVLYAKDMNRQVH